MYLQLILVFLDVCSLWFREELCNVVLLCKINMIWWLWHKSYLLFLLWSDLLWCCDQISYHAATCSIMMLFWYNVAMIDSLSVISMRPIFLLLFVALWVDMFYGQCFSISNIVTTVWCYDDCISFEYTFQVEEMV